MQDTAAADDALRRGLEEEEAQEALLTGGGDSGRGGGGAGAGGVSGGGGDASSGRSRAERERVVGKVQSKALTEGSILATRTVNGGGGLINASLEKRPMFRKRGEGGGEDGNGGKQAAAEEKEGFMAQAMEQGLQHSVCRVQHDNPWLEEFLQAEFTSQQREPKTDIPHTNNTHTTPHQPTTNNPHAHPWRYYGATHPSACTTIYRMSLPP